MIGFRLEKSGKYCSIKEGVHVAKAMKVTSVVEKEKAGDNC